jgi:hypothetical protein
MSYKPETQSVLSGGLSLLPPGDLVKAEDALALLNWRVNQAGSLRSRLGDTLIYRVPVGNPWIHTLFTANQASVHRYAGIGTDLYKDWVPLASGFDGSYVAMVPFEGYLWIMNRGKQLRYDGAVCDTWLPFAPSNPTVTDVLGGALVDTKTYTYWITFLTAEGQETNPNPDGQDITIATPNLNAQIARPLSPDARATAWNVYRVGNTLDGAYRVNADPIPIGAATWTDDGLDTSGHDDVSVERLGIALETDHDPAPECAGMVGPYYGKLVAFNSADHPNWFWWTATNRPYYFPGSSIAAGSHAPAGEEGEAIVATMPHVRQLRFYKDKSVWRLTGDPDDYTGDLEQTNAEIGLIGAKAIVANGALDYFQGQEGIYACNGDSVKDISAGIKPIFLGDWVGLPDGTEIAPPINPDLPTRQKACMAFKNGRLYFSYADATVPAGSRPNVTLVCDVASGRWVMDSRGFMAMYYEGQLGGDALGSGDLLAAAPSMIGPTVWGLEYPVSPGSPFTTAIPLAYHSGFRDQGRRDRQKTYADVAIEHSCLYGAAGAEALTVKAYYDSGQSHEDLGTISVALTDVSGPARIRDVFALGGGDGKTARNVSIRIEGNSYYDVQIFSIEVRYYFEAPDAKTFDSGVTELGTERVKQLDLLEIVIDASGPVNYKILTDLPGNVLASRVSSSFPGTSGRQAVRLPITGVVEGRLVRVLLESQGAPFRVSAIRFRLRPIGVYRDGANGETWFTQETGVGI